METTEGDLESGAEIRSSPATSKPGILCQSFHNSVYRNMNIFRREAQQRAFPKEPWKKWQYSVLFVSCGSQLTKFWLRWSAICEGP